MNIPNKFSQPSTKHWQQHHISIIVVVTLSATLSRPAYPQKTAFNSVGRKFEDCHFFSLSLALVDYDATKLKRETVDYGNDATAPTEPYRTGYSFIGWDIAFSNVTSDLKVTAQYTLTSAVNEVEIEEIIIYPNPVKDFLTINMGNLSFHSISPNLSVMDMAGNIIYKIPNFNGKKTIDVTNLQSGIYFIGIASGCSLEQLPIIKDDYSIVLS